jgi:hypothetical protein
MRSLRDAASLEALGARAESWVRSWPSPHSVAPFRKSRLATEGTPTRRPMALQISPYWTMLPLALAGRKRRRRPAPRFVRDVLWAQFCLFLFVRIQDDLFDGQAAEKGLIYVADQFLIEAERTFGRHFARSHRFWGLLHDALETSTRAILRVDQLQQEGSARPPELLEAYAQVAEIFKVGTAAVCLKQRRPRDLVALSRFADEMAMAGQIIDDLEDVEEDLRRCRFNYVAKRLLAGHSAEPAQAVQRVAREIMLGEGALRILSEAECHVERASTALGGVDCAAARAEVACSLRALARLKTVFHRRSVEVVLGPLMKGPLSSPVSGRA